MAYTSEIIVMDWKLRTDDNHEIFYSTKDSFSVDIVYVSKSGTVDARIHINKQNNVKTSAKEGIQVNISFTDKAVSITPSKY